MKPKSKIEHKETPEIINQEVEVLNTADLEGEDFLLKEVETSTEELLKEDQQIVEIEKSASLSDSTEVEMIKKEINLVDNIKEINDAAINLKEETVQAVSLIDFEGINQSQNEEYLLAEEKIKKIENDLFNLAKLKDQIPFDEYEIFKKSKEIEILENRGNLLSLNIPNNKTENIKTENKENDFSTTEDILLAEIKKTKDRFIKNISYLEDKASSDGYNLDEIIEMRDSEEEEKLKLYKDLEKEVLSLNLSEDIDYLRENNFETLLNSIGQIKSNSLKKEIWEDGLREKIIPREKIIEKGFKDVVNDNNREEVIASLKERLSKDKQEALKKLSVEDIISSWEEEKPISKGWGGEGYGSELAEFSQKISNEIDKLSKDGNIDGIIKLKERLDSLRASGAYGNNMVSFESSYPKWLKDLNINSNDSLAVLTKSLTPESFKYYFDRSNKFIPFHLIPDYIEGEERDKYYDRFFLTDFDINDLNGYFKETGKDKEKILKKGSLILLNSNSSYEKINTILESLRLNNISEDFYGDLEIKQATINNIVNNLNNLEITEANMLKELFKISSEEIAKEFMIRGIRNIADFNKIKILNEIFDFTTYLEKNEGDTLKVESFKRIENTSQLINNPETMPEQITEILTKFEGQYGKKGKDLINLAIYTYGIKNPDQFTSKMRDIENVLNKYNPDNIPDGAKVSMGIEYEVTNSIVEAYEKTSLLGYKSDITLVSEIGNIGKGRDAVHEIATKPNYNPYMLMAEVKLLQDAGFLDFTFERYNKAPRGYHLSLVGDGGLNVDKNMYFLNNIMTMAQISGVTAGKDVNSTKDIHKKTFENFSDHNQKGERCEIKGMATDSVEQFEKAIMTAHHAGIAIQLCNKYLGPDKEIINIPETPEEFEQALSLNGILLKSFENEKERDIVFTWSKFKLETVLAVDRHNESFINNELNGFKISNDGELEETLSDDDRNLNLNHLRDDKITKEDLLEKVKIKSSDLFTAQTTDFVNGLTRLNNFFLLKSVNPNKGQYITIELPYGEKKETLNLSNIRAIWTMKNEGNLKRENDVNNNQNISLFDNNGEMRDGYYYIQGSSEEMIINKAQILLNHFNRDMEKLLQKKGIKRDVEKEELVEA